MRPYEVAFIAHPEVDEDGLIALADKVQGWITAAGGTIDKVERLGKKRMAYEIRKQRDGHYVIVNAQLNSGGPIEVERNLRLNEQILRFMIIRTDEPAPVVEEPVAETPATETPATPEAATEAPAPVAAAEEPASTTTE
jgi:small subunit ribosomal protein S6